MKQSTYEIESSIEDNHTQLNKLLENTQADNKK